MLRNKTKIIATVGPASRTKTELGAMIRAGVDIFRINGSYEDPEHHAKTIELIRSVARHMGKPVAVLVDLPGPKFRLGKLKQTEMTLKSGTTVTLHFGQSTQSEAQIPVPNKGIARSLKPGHTVFINDGIVALKVLKVKGNRVSCKVTAGGAIRSGKGLNLPRVPLELPSLTPRDRELARMAARVGVDFVGLSFVRSAKNIKDLRSIFKRSAPHIGIVAKIEKPEALDELDAIIEASDAIMVARGDLGIEMPFDQIPVIQRHILKRCIAEGKPAITATQMLESMVNSSRPTRAEATDVAGAVWEGTDAVMLSEETSIGVNPARAVRAMAQVARSAEKEMPPLVSTYRPRLKREIQAHAISRSACLLADHLGAKAIATPTRSGRTPLYVSRFRPSMLVLAPTTSEKTARRMCLFWGVVPMLMPSFKTLDELLGHAGAVARKSGYIHKGDTIIITSGAHGKKDDIVSLVEVRRV